MGLVTDLLRRLLFVQAHPASVTHIRGTSDHIIVTALIERARERSVGQLLRLLESEVVARLASRAPEWRLIAWQLFGPPPLERAVVFFMEATRSYRATAALRQLEGEAPPAPYHLPVTPLYDAVVELRFAAPPAVAALDEIRRLFSLSGFVRSVALVGSSHQVEVYDSGSSVDEQARVNICFLIRRPPGMSREACQQYWSHQHAQLALDNMRYLGLTRYRQVHTLLTVTPGLDDTYDGVVYAEKASLSRLLRDLLKINTARFNDTVVVDESHFTHATPVMLMRRRQARALDSSTAVTP
jgi:hypothetical protein